MQRLADEEEQLSAEVDAVASRVEEMEAGAGGGRAPGGGAASTSQPGWVHGGSGACICFTARVGARGVRGLHLLHSPGGCTGGQGLASASQPGWLSMCGGRGGGGRDQYLLG